MKTLTVNVTREDLEADATNPIDCPVYRAMKRADPRTQFVAATFCEMQVGREIETIKLPPTVAHVIGTMMLYPAFPRKPFSFAVEVPD